MAAFVPKPSIEVDSFNSFLQSFPLQGESLYNVLFVRHTAIIQTQKAKVAAANLEKILNATFDVSSVSGFDRMSLRDLSRQTDMSMGAIYSCISKKEDIALMVADIVRMSNELVSHHALQEDSVWSQLKASIRYHLYASTLLQPWYFFLYFETRSLPQQQQAASKQIELDAIEDFRALIETGKQRGEFAEADAKLVANVLVVLLEDWYLKPWKTKLLVRGERTIEKQEEKIDEYYQSLIKLMSKLLGLCASN